MPEDPFWKAARDAAAKADAADPLAGFRARFRLPAGLIYLDGNSLGPAPEAALEAASVAVGDEWAGRLIESWNSAGWWDLPVRLGDMLAPVIGAGQGEVVVCDTVSVNVFKCLCAGLTLRPGRQVIVAEAAGFPTDVYVAEGVRGLIPGIELRLADDGAGALEALIDDGVAVVLVNHVDYRSGRRRDLAGLTKRIHAAGALALWDLCHSAGVMPVGLAEAGADLAVGCTYKYLNGGPGAPAFVYCARRHQAQVRQPLSGWWGHARPFDFAPGFAPDPGIRRFLCGTQPILSMRAAEAGLALAAEADPDEVRTKSEALTQRFLDLAVARCRRFGVALASPAAAEERGSQVSLTHAEGHSVVRALAARGVTGDFRAPDIMRFGFAPLYLRHADVVAAVEALEAVLERGEWKAVEFRARAAVT